MRRIPALLIIGTAGIVMAVVGYFVVLAIEPNSTVCYGTPKDGYCDTHASHWAVVGLFAGLVIGGAAAFALIRRGRRDPAA